ncbi:MAG: PQQ-dependent sugar dehydrogenase [Verrucomicrobiales bacterium]|nr:PQQ-dependent sugar dehydrogenase [Verrucomicrobiales bacterium]
MHSREFHERRSLGIRGSNRDRLRSLWRGVRAAAGGVALTMPGWGQAATVPEGVWVRAGFELKVAVDGIKSPRFMEVAPDGALFVSVPNQGKIFRCVDADGDGFFEKATTFVQGKEPKTIMQGMQFHDGWLWFAQLNSISKARDTDGDGRANEEFQVLNAKDLPTGKDGGHMWRALLIHKGRIYTHVGDQTNATDEPIDASERKKIWSFALDGSDKKLFASGVRNTEKFAVRPGTDEIWGVDHDIDQMGARFEGDRKNGQPFTDHNPPAELNLYKEGAFYGHPWIVGKTQPNWMFLDHPDLLKFAGMTTNPEWIMPAHSAANALTFYRGSKIPGARGDAFVAHHGGWNSTRKVGYSVTRVLFEDGHPYGEQRVVDFLKNGTEPKGRPVDVVEAADGSLLITDDSGNLVYRLRYVGP